MAAVAFSPEEEARLKEKIKKAYELFDKDGTGSVIQECVAARQAASHLAQLRSPATFLV